MPIRAEQKEDDHAGRYDSVSARAPDINNLCQAVLSLGDEEECRRFFVDLFTPAELRAFSERWQVARLLDETCLSYRDIRDKTGVSTTTVARVARFLRDEPHQGYRLVLDRIRNLHDGSKKRAAARRDSKKGAARR